MYRLLPLVGAAEVSVGINSRSLSLTDIATGGVLSSHEEGDGIADPGAREIEVNI